MKIRKLLSLSLVVTLVVLMLGSIPAMAEERKMGGKSA